MERLHGIFTKVQYENLQLTLLKLSISCLQLVHILLIFIKK